MNIAFAGTPEFAVTALNAIAESSHAVVRVFTQPDRPSGRGRKIQASPVSLRAEALGIPTEKPQRFDSPAISALEDSGAQILVVVAYGLILPQAALDTPPLGAINIHASLLPRWRGAAPLQRAIAAGDRKSGVTIMQMDSGLDTGPVLLAQEISVGDKTNSAQLHDSLAAIGGDLVVDALDRLALGTLSPQPQPSSGVCYAHKLSKEEARIDWCRSAVEIERKIRALNPVPVCWTAFDNDRLRIHAAELAQQDWAPTPGQLRVNEHQVFVSCQDAWLRLLQVQAPGGRVVPAEQWARSLSDHNKRLN